MTDTNILNPGSFITIRFKSQPPATRFAPEWDFHIGEKNIVESVDVDSLTTYLLEQEKVIVEKYPAGSDGSTKLGPKSVTARFQHFNLMAFDHPEIQALKKSVRRFTKEFCLDIFGMTYRQPTLYIRSWFNVMRKGQRIQKHLHSLHPHTYLGGHFTVACDNSSTIYVNPYDHADIPRIEERVIGENETYESGSFYRAVNVPGKLTLFPNYVPHFTTKHMAETERITIAFDITPLPKGLERRDSYVKL